MSTILKDVNGHKHTKGKYSVSESRVTFKDYWREPSVMYAFTIRNDLLTFSVDEDPCDPGWLILWALGVLIVVRTKQDEKIIKKEVL